MPQSRSAALEDRMTVFISYSRADLGHAENLVRQLEDAGYLPSIDRYDIDAAEQWKQRLGDLIHECDAVVFMLTQRSASSPHCAWEVDEAARCGKRVLPIVVEPLNDVEPPPGLASLNYIYFHPNPADPRSGPYFGWLKLDEALRTDLGWVREQTRYFLRASEWEARGRPDELLLRGVLLEEALLWLGRMPRDAEVQLVTRTYLAASEQGAARAQAESAEQKQKMRAMKSKINWLYRQRDRTHPGKPEPSARAAPSKPTRTREGLTPPPSAPVADPSRRRRGAGLSSIAWGFLLALVLAGGAAAGVWYLWSGEASAPVEAVPPPPVADPITWQEARRGARILDYWRYVVENPTDAENYDDAIARTRARIRALGGRPTSRYMQMSGAGVFREIPSTRAPVVATRLSEETTRLDVIDAGRSGVWYVFERPGERWPFLFAAEADIAPAPRRGSGAR